MSPLTPTCLTSSIPSLPYPYILDSPRRGATHELTNHYMATVIFFLWKNHEASRNGNIDTLDDVLPFLGRQDPFQDVFSHHQSLKWQSCAEFYGKVGGKSFPHLCVDLCSCPTKLCPELDKRYSGKQPLLQRLLIGQEHTCAHTCTHVYTRAHTQAHINKQQKS